MNFTGDVRQITLADLACTIELTGKVHGELIAISAINIFLSMTAFLGNVLILVALQKESSLQPPTKLLFRSLATTDLLNGIIVQPLFVIQIVSMVTEQWNICLFVHVGTGIPGYILGSVSLLTLTAISVDRLLVLLLGFQYRQLATLKRTYVFVGIAWVWPVLCIPLYLRNTIIVLWSSYIIISLCVATSVSSYAKIFLTLRRKQMQIGNHVQQGQSNQTVAVNIVRYRSTVYSVLWVQLALVLCYLPNSMVQAFITRRGLTPSLFMWRKVVATILFFNSSLNPILYCWKIKGVKQAVKDTVRQLCC